MGFSLGKPDLRAEMERDMKLIAEGQKTKEEVLSLHLSSMKETLNRVVQNKDGMYKYLQKHLRSDSSHNKHEMIKNTEFWVCPTCKYDKLLVRLSREDKLFIACKGFPKCKTTLSLPDGIEYLEKLSNECTEWKNKKKGYVNLFKLQFEKAYYENEQIFEILNGKDHGEFCLNKGWDSKITALIAATRKVSYVEAKKKVKKVQKPDE